MSKRCKADGCDTFSVFGSPNGCVLHFCGVHEEEGHVNLVNKRCEAVGCDMIPIFGRPDARVKRFCKTQARGRDASA